jgi:hypothetical protein
VSTYRFEQIVLKATRRWTENGKKRQETRTFMQTLNPYNKNADGSLKSRGQIYAELIAERKAWLDANREEGTK